MIEMTTRVVMRDVTTHDIYEFMLDCTDESYRRWWPGTHLEWHTVKGADGALGSTVYFDEHVGDYRLKMQGVICEKVPDRRIDWQMKLGVRLPAHLVIGLEPDGDGVLLTHTVSAGFRGIGRVLDPVLRLYLSPRFERQLTEHAQTEFPMLAEMLSA